MVFGLILRNGNSCNFAGYPTRYVKNSPRLRLGEFLTYLVGYLKNTPRTDFKSPKYPSAAPRSIWEIWNWSSGYFLQIVPELHFARDISNKNDTLHRLFWNQNHLLKFSKSLVGDFGNPKLPGVILKVFERFFIFLQSIHHQLLAIELVLYISEISLLSNWGRNWLGFKILEISQR